jgi:copper chaperone CopZ
MKTLKIFIALLAISINIVHAQITKAELQVSGLTCSMCAKATEKSLHTLNFIGDIKPDLNRNVFVITFKKDMQVNLDQISKKVQSAGFFVNNLKVTFNFDNVKLTNNNFSFTGDTYRLMNGTNEALNGPVTLTVVDKGFAPVAVYKKYNSTPVENVDGKSVRVYHLAI